jgi:hypothetical protein
MLMMCTVCSRYLPQASLSLIVLVIAYIAQQRLSPFVNVRYGVFCTVGGMVGGAPLPLH